MDHDDLAAEEAKIIAEYAERYKPHPYRQVFFPPASDDWKVDALYVDGFFEAAKNLLEGIVAGRLSEGLHGVAAVYLCRHYLELEIKYTLFHSRWLKHENANAGDGEVAALKEDHNLQGVWDTLLRELKGKVPSLWKSGLDLNFVSKCVAEFQRIDPGGWRFRYPQKHIAVAPANAPRKDTLGISFDSLLLNLTRARDVLDTLDGRLVDQYGENEEWQSILNDL
jgi:hypothetical protein